MAVTETENSCIINSNIKNPDENENLLVKQVDKPILSKIKKPLGLSPPKTPLSSSSLANINQGSPLKPECVRRTPQKLNQPSLSPLKQIQSPLKQDLSKFPEFKNIKIEEPANEILDTTTAVHIKQEASPQTVSGYEEDLNFGTEEPRSIPSVGKPSESSCRKRFSSLRRLEGEIVRPPVSRRNARERNRVKQVSLGFSILRQHIPNLSNKKKLSKVETLRGAVEYIKNLQNLLQETPQTPPSNIYHTQSTPGLQTHQTIHNLPTPPPQSDQYLHLPQFNLPVQNKYQRLMSMSGSFNPGSIVGAGQAVRQMQNSCLESHVLRVPKLEDGFYTSLTQGTSDILCGSSPNLRTIPVQLNTSNFEPTTSCHLNNSLPSQLPVFPDSVPVSTSDYFREYQQKETSDVDLMEALDWWQHNS